MSVCVWVNYPSYQVKGEWKGEALLFVLSVLHCWRQHVESCIYQSANQEARLFFLQLVAGAVHHKCFKWAVSSPPLNEYTCKPCFWEAQEGKLLIYSIDDGWIKRMVIRTFFCWKNDVCLSLDLPDYKHTRRLYHFPQLSYSARPLIATLCSVVTALRFLSALWLAV